MPPTRLTRIAVLAGCAVIVLTAAMLLQRYQQLPDILPVHFARDGRPNGWQYRTYWRVLMPVFVQASLGVTLWSIGALLLSRPHGGHEAGAPDVRAAAAAAEAIALIALVWIAFQSYAGYAVAGMWQRERGGLGVVYVLLEITGFVVTMLVFSRAMVQLGRPAPRPFVAEHWVLGHLYRNRHDPALFVPTRDGSRWTLNFGRPVAAALMAVILGAGVVGPAVILRLLLR